MFVEATTDSHVEVHHVERCLLDELAAGFDLVAHQVAEDLVGFNAVFDYAINDAVRLEVGGTVYSDYADAAGYFGRYAGRESFFLRLHWML